MKAVLMSVKPKWCELIASGKKTVEVRKTKPKIETPFKCYIYETQGKIMWCNKCENIDCERPYPNCACLEGRGKVIGEFVCDRIDGICWASNPTMLRWKNTYNKNSCLTDNELYDYTNGGMFYEWNISDLVIYDKPREFGEFYSCNGLKPLKRPPQSWCYVEEVTNA